jgi:SpoVK/Ycf46/Vps4 family AAA+-type ATPase
VLNFLLSRYRLVLVAIAIVGFGIFIIPPVRTRAAAWGHPSLQNETNETNGSIQQLEQTRVELHRSIEVKASIIAELLAARITLEEATEQFLILTTNRPKTMQMIRSRYPGKTDREKMARNVMEATQQLAEPHERDALRDRLEAELQQMLTGSTAE